MSGWRIDGTGRSALASRNDPAISVIVVTGHADVPLAVAAIRGKSILPADHGTHAFSIEATGSRE